MDLVKKIETEGLTIQEKVTALQVEDQVTYDVASHTLLMVQSHIKKLNEALDPQCKKAYESWQLALSQKKKYIGPFDELVKTLKVKMGDYEIEQERVQALEQEKLRQQAKLDTDALKDKYKEAIDKAVEGGDLDEAEALRQESETMVIPPRIADVPISKMKGIVSSDDYDVEIVDAFKFLKVVSTKKIQIAVDKIITWKLGGIKAYIKNTGITEIPGVMIRKTKIIGGRPHEAGLVKNM